MRIDVDRVIVVYSSTPTQWVNVQNNILKQKSVKEKILNDLKNGN